MEAARTIRLGPGSEFDLIRSFLGGAGPLPGGVLVGPGDDCAVLDAGRLAVTCDASIEGVHFRRGWLTPEEVGWRAGAASLSDLAAVAAEPLAVLVSIAVTDEDAASGWASGVARGLERVVREAGAAVVGGDLTRSPGPAMLDVVAIGRVGTPVLRDGALPGDELWVTGVLGAAGAAVALLAAGQPLPAELKDAFAHPTPRWREALWLRERAPLHAMIDLSDGLLGDAGHLAAASGVRIDLEAGLVPVAPSLKPLVEREDERLRLALQAGEDYELLLVAPPGMLGRVAGDFRARFGVPLTRVGEVVPGEGVWLGDGESARPARGGFDHFAGGGRRASGAPPGGEPV